MKPFTSAVILAAGNSSRMRGVEKITMLLAGKPLIYYSIESFERSKTVDEIIIVTRADIKHEVENAARGFEKVKAVVLGGDCREASAANGFFAVSPDCLFIAVHDGARPFITEDDIDRINKAAYDFDAVCCGIPITDTVKEVDSERIIRATPDRTKLFAAATPQVFSAEIYQKAIINAGDNIQNYTDDSGMVEAIGIDVRMVLCNKHNIKLTTSEDIAFAEFLIKRF